MTRYDLMGDLAMAGGGSRDAQNVFHKSEW